MLVEALAPDNAVGLLLRRCVARLTDDWLWADMLRHVESLASRRCMKPEVLDTFSSF